MRYLKYLTVLIFVLLSACGSSSSSDSPENITYELVQAALHCSGATVGTMSGEELTPLLIDGDQSLDVYELNENEEIIIDLRQVQRVAQVGFYGGLVHYGAFSVSFSRDQLDWKVTANVEGTGDVPCDLSIHKNQFVCSFLAVEEMRYLKLRGETASRLSEVAILAQSKTNDARIDTCDSLPATVELVSDETLLIRVDGEEITTSVDAITLDTNKMAGNTINLEIVDQPRGYQCSVESTTSLLFSSNPIHIACEKLASVGLQANIVGLNGTLVLSDGVKLFEFNNDGLVSFSETYFPGDQLRLHVASSPEGLSCTLATDEMVFTHQAQVIDIHCLSQVSSRYSKLSVSGQMLPDSATDWSCVLDERTGLVWEVKTNDGGMQDSAWEYTHSTNLISRDEAKYGKETCGGDTDDLCDTETYVNRVNETQLCGFSDWRLPLIEEVSGLLTSCSEGEVEVASPDNISDETRFCVPLNSQLSDGVDTRFFRNLSATSGSYWSSTPGERADTALRMDFVRGLVRQSNRSFAVRTMLVRGEQPTYSLTIQYSGQGKSVSISNGEEELYLSSDANYRFARSYNSYETYGLSGTDLGLQNCYLSTSRGFFDHANIAIDLSCLTDQYIKISAEGESLAAEVSEWHCVRDEATGLIWEVKTNDGSVRDRDWSYLNSSNIVPGYDPRDMEIDVDPIERCGYTRELQDNFYCDTEDYVSKLNEIAHCGLRNWRLPSKEELRTLVKCSNKPVLVASGNSSCGPSGSFDEPAINSAFFPNPVRSEKGSIHWTSTQSDSTSNVGNWSAWHVSFLDGAVSSSPGLRWLYGSARLVSD